MKKIVSVLLVLAMLPILAFSAQAATPVINPTVTHSVTEEAETGLGLAFRFEMNAQGVTVDTKNVFINDTATVMYGGRSVQLVEMGAIVSNDPRIGTDTDRMVLENAQPHSHTVQVQGKILCDVSTNGCAFAVRIINIPASQLRTTIYARPYYVIAEDGVEKTLYGGVDSRDYNNQWCIANTQLPAIGTDIDVTKKKNRIRVSAAYREGDTAFLTFRNYTSNWITEETDYVKYRYCDLDGNELKEGTIYIGCIDTKKNKEKTFEITALPDQPVIIELTASKIVYWTEWA
jgi:hypothetical protein